MKMKSNPALCSMVLLAGILACLAMPVNAAVIYSQNFESTGVTDGAFVSGWTTTGFTFGTNNGYLLNPTGSGSVWLNPVPAELGNIFATLPQGALATGNTGQKFVAGQAYELTFTHFRRDDTSGLGVIASIGNSTVALSSTNFSAVTATDTFLTRTVNYTATVGDAGQDIFIRLGQTGTLSNSLQAGIDNIALATVPEPSTAALLGISLAAAMLGAGRLRFRR